jgi:single-stranded-DNA-specific exonuclease
MGDTKSWRMPEEISVPQAYQAAVGGHPLVAQTLYQRGYQTVESARAFLNPEVYQPAPASDLPDLLVACELLANAIQKKAHILVWGDFDVDGQTATTVLVEGLRQLGGVVSHHIPVRAEESHGINRSRLKAKLATGFDLLLTCDTGITEHANLQFVRNLGIPIIVTDHHTLGETLPPANAVINPQRLPGDHPLHALPGVGVAYKLIEGLYNMIGDDTDLGPLLELVALGIVADVAELHGDNRYLLQKGLQRLRRTHRLGLNLLYKNAEINPANLNEGHIGFQIAPRLNAVGRLGDANPMVDFLTTQDTGNARIIAHQIEALNTKRRFDTRQVEQAAEMHLSASSADRHAPAIVLHNPTWPGGVVGIVASRLVERYQKPAILLTGEDPLHGSARSVPGLHITEAIAAQADLLRGYGGHPMAAGLSLPAVHYNTFKRRFLSTVEDRLKDVHVVDELPITQVLTLDQINLDFVQEIERMAPFGPGNPPLHFLLEDLRLISTSQVGANQEHRQVTVADKIDNELRLIWWNGGDEPLPEARFDLVCKLTRTDYKGTPQVSAEWIDFRMSEAGRKEVEARHVEIIDYRSILNPQTQLTQCLEEDPEASLLGEGILPGSHPFLPEPCAVKGRHELAETAHLVILTAPPSQSVLRNVIHRTQPKKLTVFGTYTDPKLDDLEHFMNRLAGIAKYAFKHMAGRAPLDRLAAGCAADETAVILGLQLWGARGTLKVEFEERSAHITIGPIELDPQIREKYETILVSILAESRAFRAYFLASDIQSLLTR